MIIPSDNAIAIIIRRDLMFDIGSYDTVKSTTSSMYDTYAQVLEYNIY